MEAGLGCSRNSRPIRYSILEMENGQGERRGGRAQLKQIAKGEHESKIARAAVMLAYLALGLHCTDAVTKPPRGDHSELRGPARDTLSSVLLGD